MAMSPAVVYTINLNELIPRSKRLYSDILPIKKPKIDDPFIFIGQSEFIKLIHKIGNIRYGCLVIKIFHVNLFSIAGNRKG